MLLIELDDYIETMRGLSHKAERASQALALAVNTEDADKIREASKELIDVGIELDDMMCAEVKEDKQCLEH